MKININKKQSNVRPAPPLFQGNIYQNDDGNIYIYSKAHNSLVNLDSGNIFNWAGGYGSHGSEFVNVTDKYEIVERKAETENNLLMEAVSKTIIRDPISPVTGTSIHGGQMGAPLGFGEFKDGIIPSYL